MFRYSVSSALLTGLRLSRAARRPPHAFRILLFHDIPTESVDKFDAFVSHVVKSHGVLTPDQAASWLDGGTSADGCPARWRAPCLFSFDDGFFSNLLVAQTVLKRHGIKALFFITPGLTALSGEAQRKAIAANVFQGRITSDQLDPRLRLVTWQELAHLKQQGHVIGCHGLSHRRLSDLSGKALRQEIIDAGDMLDAELQQRTDWYAYAFGDINSINGTALQTIAGRFRYCRSGLRGANTAMTPVLALNADSMTLDAPPSYQKLLLEGGLDFSYADKRRAMIDMLPADPVAPLP